ncbi:hypothetical protein C475_07315 [Halosimplex carlsbadense 2-9-1]|uniref:Uncharacterized protein n=1 Tax=Halosimplex carlsbadense 2-9-1 TaxID=797114 RepID=M0CWV1_9EURY|nr:hypothetical protein [Halosimplex carlsbadense]ELZ27711.1 hypothetical protein C475_07315 [Halosimplex carlsbadense 2-9-1]
MLDAFRRGAVAMACRWALVVAVTGVEAAALSVWLALLADASPASREAAVGVVVLAAAFLVGQFLVDLAVNGSAVGFPLGRTLGVALSETAVWTGWLAVVAALGDPRGALVGGVALAVALAAQHTAEVDALRGAPLGSRLVDPSTVGYSLVTAAGATAWLALEAGFASAGPLADLPGSASLAPETLGLVVLVVALLVEHVAGVAVARRECAERTAPAWFRSRSST